MVDPAARATYLAYRTGGVAARVMPPALAGPLAAGIGRGLRWAMRDRAGMVARHQRRVLGDIPADEVRRQVEGAFASYGRYWLELFRLPHVGVDELARRFRVDGYEHVEAGLAAGKGVIIALPHLGGWEWAGAWMAAVKQQRLLVVVEPVEPPELFEWFAEVRSAMGMEVVALGEGAAAQVTRALRDNRIVCLLSDRDLTGDGVDVEFFGERTTLPAGPATLALRTGAALLPVAVYFDGESHHGVVRPPIPLERSGRLRDDVARLTQMLAGEFETLVRAAPDQWHLMQPNWPSDRADGRVD